MLSPRGTDSSLTFPHYVFFFFLTSEEKKIQKKGKEKKIEANPWHF